MLEFERDVCNVYIGACRVRRWVLYIALMMVWGLFIYSAMYVCMYLVQFWRQIAMLNQWLLGWRQSYRLAWDQLHAQMRGLGT